VLLHLRSANHSGACVFSLTLSAPTLPALISALKEAAQSSIDPAPTALTSPAEVLGEPQQAGLVKAPRKKKDLTPSAEPTAAPTAEPTAALVPPPSAPAPSSITLIGLRSQLLELSDAGHRSAVRDLLNQFGVERLTDLPVTEYEAFALQATGLAQPI
jgi:hypothetical protein